VKGPWIASRQAYFPLWRPLLVSTAVLLSVDAALAVAGVRLAFWAGLLVGVAITSTICRVWIWRWRRRHPLITPRAWLDAQRRAAPWN
jgi:hypothetical protein